MKAQILNILTLHKVFHDLYLNMLTTTLLGQLELSVWVLTAKISPSYSQSSVTDASERQEVLPVTLSMRCHVSCPNVVVSQLQLWRLHGMVYRSPWANCFRRCHIRYTFCFTGTLMSEGHRPG